MGGGCVPRDEDRDRGEVEEGGGLVAIAQGATPVTVTGGAPTCNIHMVHSTICIRKGGK